MRQQNPVREGLKKHRTAHDYFLELKHRANNGGLTAMEWDWYRARQGEWEPEVLAAERAAAERNRKIEGARTLSIDDLVAILKEKHEGGHGQSIEWLRGLAEKGGKGVVNNIDARCLGRIADDLERLCALVNAAPAPQSHKEAAGGSND